MKYPLRSQILSGLGTGLILTFSLVITFQLYANNVEHAVYTTNYTTNLLIPDTLTQTTGAAPWLLVSVLWFACRTTVKKWRKFIYSYFG